MVGTTCKTVFASLIEIIFEFRVNARCTFSSLNHDKTHRKLVNHSMILKFLPVNIALVVWDVYAMYFVSFWIADITIEGTPTETERTDKDIIKEEHISGHHQTSAQPPSPPRHVLQQTNKDIRTPMLHYASSASGCRFTFMLVLLLRH